MSIELKDSGVGGDLETASDLESLPSSQASSISSASPKPEQQAGAPTLPGPSVSRSRYNSPLSSFRNNYKPQTQGTNFKPICFSSPIPKPVQTTAEESVDLTAPPGSPDVLQTSLTGRGGDWRGPQTGDMLPQNHRFTPRGGQQGSPFRGRNRNSSFGRFDDRFGDNSFSSNSSWSANSFANCSGTPQSKLYSPYPSSDGSFSSRRGNNRSHNSSRAPDISQFIHPLMTEDPWSELVSNQQRNGRT